METDQIGNHLAEDDRVGADETHLTVQMIDKFFTLPLDIEIILPINLNG
jgi:hypothetical protein